MGIFSGLAFLILFYNTPAAIGIQMFNFMIYSRAKRITLELYMYRSDLHLGHRYRDVE